MFFLLRVAFWLTIVLALLPSGGTPNGAQAKVGATDAVVAASAAVSDMSGFCGRQPGACEVGAQTAVAIGQRAQAGAKMVYEFINDHTARSDKEPAERTKHGTTGSVTKVAAVRTVPANPGSQSTLKPTDLDPDWRGPIDANETVPLPRPRPRTESQRKV
jgi:hypothetical protein